MTKTNSDRVSLPPSIIPHIVELFPHQKDNSCYFRSHAMELYTDPKRFGITGSDDAKIIASINSLLYEEQLSGYMLLDHELELDFLESTIEYLSKIYTNSWIGKRPDFNKQMPLLQKINPYMNEKFHEYLVKTINSDPTSGIAFNDKKVAKKLLQQVGNNPQTLNLLINTISGPEYEFSW